MAKITQLQRLVNPTGNELVVVADLEDAGKTKGIAVGPLAMAAAMPAVDLAEAARDGAEAAALAALVALGDGIYDTVADGIAATNDGEGFYVRGNDSGLELWIRGGATARLYVAFATRSSLRNNGINLWEVAKGDGETNDTDSIAEAVDSAASWKVGRINCGSDRYTYKMGGDFHRSPNSDFNRGLVELRSSVALVGAAPGSRPTFKMAGGYYNPGGLFSDRFWEGNFIEGVHLENLILDGNIAAQTWNASGGTDLGGGDAGADVFQHGHLVALLLAKKISARRCAFRNARGDGITTGGRRDGVEYDFARDLLVEYNEFENLFRQGVNAATNVVRLIGNRYSGDGFWVGAVTLEVGEIVDVVQDFWAAHEQFDFRIGVSPPERTPRWRATSAEAAARRIHLRRAYAASGNFYTSYPDFKFPGKLGRLSLVHPKIWQGTIDCFGFDRVHIDQPQIENTYEDTTDHFLIGPNAIHAGPARDADRVTGLADFIVSKPIIRSDLGGPGIHVSRFERVNIGGGSIVGGRDAGIRLESCGGSVTDMDIQNVGRLTVGGDAAIRDASSSAITVFGTGGDLTIADIRAKDTRVGDARRMTQAVYANVSTETLTRIRDVTGRNMRTGVVYDVNNSTLITGASDGERKLRFNSPIEANAGLKVDGLVEFVSSNGDLDIVLRAALGTNTKLSFIKGIGLEGQLIQLADGTMQINMFDNGVATGSPIAFTNDAHVRMATSWERPLEIQPGTFVWVDAAGSMRISVGRPAADNGGTVVGTQL
ncbi:hypothetical protein E5673_01370 [Sphingomonas sp. PAMC26645]|uniref:hypothetical protein n=1 Tax=Sphingomonas sp. PAMC26645 TaxID=2565555 RepID=UPI00109E1432|nr:hypothetical protein [Sphingomonas sp. PAMC26645]QCB41042.1 hypothetical protein E5673_01370 [Sphingomonas sp. PAMC26645]